MAQAAGATASYWHFPDRTTAVADHGFETLRIPWRHRRQLVRVNAHKVSRSSCGLIRTGRANIVEIPQL